MNRKTFFEQKKKCFSDWMLCLIDLWLLREVAGSDVGRNTRVQSFSDRWSNKSANTQSANLVKTMTTSLKTKATQSV